MSKFHLNAKGEPGQCKAIVGNCPFGGDADHYTSIEAAQAAAEDRHKNNYGAFNNLKKTSSSELEPIPGDLGAGRHTLEDGRIVLINWTGGISWRSDCIVCENQGENAFAPTHDASNRCESGKRAHCTCGACF